MNWPEEDWLQLSGLQHFAFCRRQWALIHIESQWAENLRTVDGAFMHRRVHDPQLQESRGDLLIVRGLAVHSARLGVSGQCDVVEFCRCPDGVSLQGQAGLWIPYPVEYKRGRPKEHDADELQLCAQALCLEEMLAKQCVNYGQRVQNSVFECLLDAAQSRLLQVKLCQIIDPQKDSLRFYYLGDRYQNRIEHFGAKATYDPEDVLIV